MTLLVEFKSATSSRATLFINPEAVESLESTHKENETTLRTRSFTYLVEGTLRETAAKVMMPEMLERAGMGFETIDKLEQAIKEKFG